MDLKKFGDSNANLYALHTREQIIGFGIMNWGHLILLLGYKEEKYVHFVLSGSLLFSALRRRLPLSDGSPFCHS